MSNDAPIHEDAALVAVLTEQVGTLNTLLTRFRLRARAAEARALAAEERAATAEAALTSGVQHSAPVSAPAPATVAAAPALGRGDISVTLDAPPPADDWDELLGDVRLL